MKARIVLVAAIAAIMVSVVATSSVEAQGLYKIDSVLGTTEQVSTTMYTDLGSANRNSQKYMFGVRLDGRPEEIDGTSGVWTFTTINNNAYTRVVGYRGASDKAFGIKVEGGLDYMTKTAGVWTTTNIADAGTRHFSDLSPESLQPMMFAAPATAADYFNGTNSGMEVFNPGLVGLYQSDKLYTDLAFGNYYYECYGAGPGGLDYTAWAGVGVQAHINDTLYNSITSEERSDNSQADIVYGAKAGGGVTKSYLDGTGWHTVDLAQAGSTEYSILWYDWGSPFAAPYDPDWIFAAGKDGGLWRLDALDVDDPLLLSDLTFTSLVGGRERGGIIYGVVSPVYPLVVQVDLQGYSPVLDTPVAVGIEVRQNGIPVRTLELIIPPSGDVSIDGLAPGDYSIALTASGYLRKVVPVTIPVQATVNVSLVNGDLDADNEVTSTDLSIGLTSVGAIGD